MDFVPQKLPGWSFCITKIRLPFDPLPGSQDRLITSCHSPVRAQGASGGGG